MKEFTERQATIAYWTTLTCIAAGAIADTLTSSDVSTERKIIAPIVLGILPTLFTAALHKFMPGCIQDAINSMICCKDKAEAAPASPPKTPENSTIKERKDSSSEVRRRNLRTARPDFMQVNPAFSGVSRKLAFSGSNGDLGAMAGVRTPPRSERKERMAFSAQQIKKAHPLDMFNTASSFLTPKSKSTKEIIASPTTV